LFHLRFPLSSEPTGGEGSQGEGENPSATLLLTLAFFASKDNAGRHESPDNCSFGELVHSRDHLFMKTVLKSPFEKGGFRGFPSGYKIHFHHPLKRRGILNSFRMAVS
jgi:hypothetical protein